MLSRYRGKLSEVQYDSNRLDKIFGLFGVEKDRSKTLIMGDNCFDGFQNKWPLATGSGNRPNYCVTPCLT